VTLPTVRSRSCVPIRPRPAGCAFGDNTHAPPSVGRQAGSKPFVLSVPASAEEVVPARHRPHTLLFPPGRRPGPGRPVSIPTEGGSGSDRCPAEHEDVQDCLAREISSNDAATCEDCVADALKAVPSAAGPIPACNDIISGLCPALSSSSSSSSSGGGGCAEWCGPCSDEILSYLACQVDALTSGCELTCRPDIVDSSDAPSDVPSAAPSLRAGLHPATRILRARLHVRG
jgi:hypothetical protein